MRPEIRILLYAVFVIGLFFIKDLTVYIIIFTGIIFLFFRIPFRSLKSGWIPISFFLLFTFVSNVLFHHGRVLYGSGPFVITAEGLNAASIRTMRVFFMIAGAKILTATTKFESLINALERIFKPLERLGIPVREFFSTMGLTMKSLPVLKEQIVKAYKERVQDGNIRGFWNRAKVVSMFLMPLFVKSMQSPESFFDDNPGHERKN